MDYIGGFNPFEKYDMIVKMGIFTKFRGENKKRLKPPPSRLPTVKHGFGSPIKPIYTLLKPTAGHGGKQGNGTYFLGERQPS